MAIDTDTVPAVLEEGVPLLTHVLVSGLTVAPGTISVKSVLCNVAFPLTATIIPEDESALFPGTPTLVDGSGTSADPAKWDFTWDSIPDIGLDAVLRLEELLAEGNGAVRNFILNVLANIEEDPTLTPPGVGGVGVPSLL